MLHIPYSGITYRDKKVTNEKPTVKTDFKEKGPTNIFPKVDLEREITLLLSKYNIVYSCL